ncbi:MAG TPA: PAAR domain-containing protein [Candidatus Dormibacteraeota bacterium]|nr:PAAR domain-containing protein [Candidatus Dormibacteraeota bacterium]
MSSPAIVMGDQLTGQCPTHLIPNPASGAPQPAPPLPFAAPLTVGLVATVLIGGKAAAVVGSSGMNTPPHVGLHPSDPFLAPPAQVGRVTSGSATVLFGGQPAATAQSACTCCATPGSLVPTVTTVLIG